MPRNPIKDALVQENRKQQLVASGLRLCSLYGIDNVTIQNIADAAGIPSVTVYKTYKNKMNIMVEISTSMWKDIWEKSQKEIGIEYLQSCNAYESMEIYDNMILDLYKEHPEVLRFSGYYKDYMNRNGAEESQYISQLDALRPIEALFTQKYERAKTDHSIRTDLPAQELFTTCCLTMLAMAERYALGIIWADFTPGNHLHELEHVKEMQLAWLRG